MLAVSAVFVAPISETSPELLSVPGEVQFPLFEDQKHMATNGAPTQLGVKAVARDLNLSETYVRRLTDADR